MSKFDKKAILSAKDSITNGGKSVKNASDKLTKIAQDMETSEVAPDPAQVKEIVESIASVAQEIVAQADTVAQGLESVINEPIIDEPPKEGEPLVGTLDEETKNKMAAQDEKIEELEEFKETNEKEKMATSFAKLFPTKQQQAKYTEFMKMDKPNSELKTVLNATENVLKSVQKTASMHRTNETIIFKDSSNQKFASSEGFSGNAKNLTEI